MPTGAYNKSIRNREDTEMLNRDYAKRLYDIGAKHRDAETFEELMDRTIDETGYLDTEDSIIFRAGWKGQFAFEIKEWERYGTLPECGFSRNYADGSIEAGISVADTEWKKSLRGKISKCTSRKITRFLGVQTGWGSDDEPTVIAIEE